VKVWTELTWHCEVTLLTFQEYTIAGMSLTVAYLMTSYRRLCTRKLVKLNV